MDFNVENRSSIKKWNTVLSPCRNIDYFTNISMLKNYPRSTSPRRRISYLKEKAKKEKGNDNIDGCLRNKINPQSLNEIKKGLLYVS